MEHLLAAVGAEAVSAQEPFSRNAAAEKLIHIVFDSPIDLAVVPPVHRTDSILYQINICGQYAARTGHYIEYMIPVIAGKAVYAHKALGGAGGFCGVELVYGEAVIYIGGKLGRRKGGGGHGAHSDSPCGSPSLSRSGASRHRIPFRSLLLLLAYVLDVCVLVVVLYIVPLGVIYEVGAEILIFLAVREIHIGYYIFIAAFYQPRFDKGAHHGGFEIPF